MNSIDRIYACIKGEDRDRHPFFCVFSLYGAKLINCDLLSYYNDSNLFIEGQTAIMEQISPDVLMSPFCFAKEAEAFGCVIKYYPTSPPNVKKNPLTHPDDIYKIQIPDITNNSILKYFRESVQKLSTKFGSSTLIAAPIMGPFELAAIVIGLENFMELLLFDYQKAKYLIDLFTEYCISWSNQLAADGANIIVHPGGFSNIKMINSNMLESYVIPVLETLYAKINIPVIYHNGGYSILPFLKYLKKLPNIVGFLVDSHDDIEKSRLEIGDKFLLLGNIDGPTLIYKNPAEIKHMCINLLEKMKNDQHYIFSTSGPDLAYQTSIEQILTMKAAVVNFETAFIAV